jgi:hypothetical protein
VDRNPARNRDCGERRWYLLGKVPERQQPWDRNPRPTLAMTCGGDASPAHGDHRQRAEKERVLIHEGSAVGRVEEKRRGRCKHDRFQPASLERPQHAERQHAEQAVDHCGMQHECEPGNAKDRKERHLQKRRHQRVRRGKLTKRQLAVHQSPGAVEHDALIERHEPTSPVIQIDGEAQREGEQRDSDPAEARGDVC